jgi:hypothetical protein
VFTDSTGNPKEINPLIMEIVVGELYLERTGTVFVPTYKYYNLTLCTEDDFPGSSKQLDSQLYSDAVYCPDNHDFKVFGNFGSQNLSALSIELNKCRGVTCADNNTMNAYLADAK